MPRAFGLPVLPSHLTGDNLLAMSAELSDILRLSVAERIQLVEDIWDSIASRPESLPLTDGERQELDRRLDAHARAPGEGVEWEELKNKVRGSK